MEEELQRRLKDLERAEAEAEARRLHEEKVRLKAEQGMKRNREIWPKKFIDRKYFYKTTN